MARVHFLPILLGTTALLFSQIALAQNLVSNGEFDNGMNSYYATGQSSVITSDGRKVLRITDKGGVVQDLQLSPGSEYYLGAGVKRNSQAGNVYVGVKFLNAQNKLLGEKSFAVPTSGTYGTVGTTFTIPSAAVISRFFIWKENNTAPARQDWAYVDWVHIDQIGTGGDSTPITPTPITPTPITPTTNCNIKVNQSGQGDFTNIASAIAAASNGQTICVESGVYGSLTVSKSVQLIATGKAIIDGGGPSKDALVINADGVTLKGFEIRNGHNGVSSWNFSNLKIENNKIHDMQRFGIILSASSRASNKGHEVIGNTVYNTVLENKSKTSSSGWARGLAIDVSDGAKVEGNCIFENYGEGLGALLSKNLNYTGNTVYDNYSVQMYFDNMADSTATGNIIFSTGNTNFYRNGTPGQGTMIANEYYSGYGDPSYISTNNLKIANNTYSAVSLPFYSTYGVGGGILNSSLTPNTTLASYNASWICSK